MISLESRICTVQEYEADFDARIHERNLAIDGIYSVVSLLKQPGSLEAAIRPVVITGVGFRVPNTHKQLPVHLRFMKEDGTLDRSARPTMRGGLLTGFGEEIAFGGKKAAPQTIETAYLKERLDQNWSEDEYHEVLKAMSAKSTK